MATISFNLQQIYKEGQRAEYIKRKQAGQKVDSLLYPNETRVYLFLTIDRHHVMKLKTNFKTFPKYWDINFGRLKPTSPGSVDLNQRIDELKTLTMKKYLELCDKGISFALTKEALSALVKGGEHHLINDKKNLTINEIYVHYMSIAGSELAERTRKKMRTLQKALTDFQAKHGAIDITSIDMLFYDRFKNYLLFERENYITGIKGGYLNDTIEKYLKNLKHFLKWSNERGFHDNKIYLNPNFEISPKKTDKEIVKNNIITLNEAELQLIREVDLSQSQRLDRIRDIFIFLVFTGQRWGDVHNFQSKYVKSGEWVFISEKTQQMITVPLVGWAEPAFKILQKYNGDLPKISDVKFNVGIKEVAALAGINTPVEKIRFSGRKKIVTSAPKAKFVSSHMGRRTAVTLLLNKGVPASTVMLLTGHTSLQTLQKYLNSDKDVLKEALSALNENEPKQQLRIAN